MALALGATQAVLGAVAIGAVQLGTGSVVSAWATLFVAATAVVVLLETRTWAPVRDWVEDTAPADDAGRRPGPRPPSRPP